MQHRGAVETVGPSVGFGVELQIKLDPDRGPTGADGDNGEGEVGFGERFRPDQVGTGI